MNWVKLIFSESTIFKIKNYIIGLLVLGSSGNRIYLRREPPSNLKLGSKMVSDRTMRENDGRPRDEEI